jgi:UTP--glucose-1-phosphate uridylyltransferase
MKVTKAVIPVAGLGTRMLPATKSIPKEMLPIVDKPLIQYVVNEAVQAGIKDVIFVTHSSKNAIENHFDRSFELESTLEKRVKRQQLAEIRAICPKNITIMHVRQGEARGLAHAISKARELVRGEPFAVILPDVLIDDYSCNPLKDNLKEMISRFEENGRTQIMVEKVARESVSSYGIIDFAANAVAEKTDENGRAIYAQGSFLPVSNLVEKPAVEDAPSDYAIVGRYVLSDNIWDYLEYTPLGAGDEIQLTDTLKLLLRENEIEAYVLKGKSMDCGSKLGYIEAFINYSMHDPRYADELKKYVEKLLKL